MLLLLVATDRLQVELEADTSGALLVDHIVNRLVDRSIECAKPIVRDVGLRHARGVVGVLKWKGVTQRRVVEHAKFQDVRNRRHADQHKRPKLNQIQKQLEAIFWT